MIRVGIGGWEFPPWRGVFYPSGLPQARELEYASRQVTAIEINTTSYRTQSPATFRRWANETPDDFLFTVKGPRYVVNRAALAGSGPGISRFMESGVTELGAKLGPILWQLPPTKPFEEADLAAFLSLLPRQSDGREIRHALEARHASFVDPRFVALARSCAVPIVYADSADYPAIADLTGAFVYARLQRGTDAEPLGYPPAELDRWAERARIWADGGESGDLPTCGPQAAAVSTPQRRLVFLFVIHEGKIRAPAAAQAIITRLGQIGLMQIGDDPHEAVKSARGSAAELARSPLRAVETERASMANEFKAGDKVAWKSHGGEAVGHVVKKLTSETHIKGHTAKASKENPEYLVESEKSGGQAAHKPDALKKI